MIDDGLFGFYDVIFFSSVPFLTTAAAKDHLNLLGDTKTWQLREAEVEAARVPRTAKSSSSSSAKSVGNVTAGTTISTGTCVSSAV